MPDLRPEKAPSVGAKIVRPLFELFRTVKKWFSSCVDLKRRMNIEKCPAFSRILVTLVIGGSHFGCAGEADGEIVGGAGGNGAAGPCAAAGAEEGDCAVICAQ